ncbi:uncharacterized protein MONOS_13570 [Monocercomonoides exilis]|uniref:uncharacterized protein n=1 Tax=Monocercomonoides exilis TaxID=2049356 RepID=UPI00355955CC|nr:hypothetical protein MONOS_13570 [Monocercomonoides exilis]|eukprot:MONOS_13570.1-p1 / transcript=MONOS_13570.1 / gene=MONOS_13570 / organism=Monocercomonoides_exilis_PA203 / gene_product=unspecified product / transcript_product=unspecified product / location=Mono_scaffold00846:24759-25594(+) / protein_length=208 / sequence_SO=supercontig / SO=protein_coding / is_pseudo=false
MAGEETGKDEAGEGRKFNETAAITLEKRKEGVGRERSLFELYGWTIILHIEVSTVGVTVVMTMGFHLQLRWKRKQQEQRLVQPKEIVEANRKSKVWKRCSKSIEGIEGRAGEESGDEGWRSMMEIKKGMGDVEREEWRGMMVNGLDVAVKQDKIQRRGEVRTSEEWEMQSKAPEILAREDYGKERRKRELREMGEAVRLAKNNKNKD